MIRNFLLKFILSLVLLPCLNAQNFEGIIIYERTTSDGKLALKTYYFGDQKIRIDSRFLFEDHYKDYVSIFDFTNYTNKYFSDSGLEPFRPIEIKRNSIGRMKVNSDSIMTVLGYECYLVEIELESKVYSSIMNQSRFHTKDLQFSVPEEWILDYIKIISGDNGIALFLEANMTSLDPELSIYFDPNKSYSYRAIKVLPKKLPEDLFDYESLLAEKK